MKIAISAMTPSLNSAIDPRFGRCRYVVFVDDETMELEAVENPNIMSLTGAGLQTAQLVANKGAQVLLTGQLGPSTERALSVAGIEVLSGIAGTVAEAVQKYKKGTLEPVGPPDRVEPVPHPEVGVSRQKLAELKSQLLAMSWQLSEIQRRIHELRKLIP
jgi:predicted Fe-Mo cluster-binding NifX family protein